MITLLPMPESDFHSFEAECTSAYARDNVRASRWPQSSGLARAQEEFRRLLPSGLSTPDHFIYNIHDQQSNHTVGFLWLAEFESGGARVGYVYSIHINPEHRGHGYAKAAIDRIEEQGLARGLTTISLHVFSHNAAAQALYRSLGYGITGFNMLKPLKHDDA
jgi:ribosomal protein S18 acetylase RimI-like enzyme